MRTNLAVVTRARVQWLNLGSLQPLPPGFQQFCLSLPIEMGFRHPGRAGLKLLASGDPPALASQTAGITGVSSRTWPGNLDFKIRYLSHFILLFLRRSFTLSPRWNAVTRSSLIETSTSQIQAIPCLSLLKTDFHHVGQAGLELLTSGDPPASATHSAGIAGLHFQSGSTHYSAYKTIEHQIAVQVGNARDSEA
ncbi:Protein GVQW1 [Plecturocebus cupreus]